MNLLQGSKMNLIKVYRIVLSFIVQFYVQKLNIGCKELTQFASLEQTSPSEDKILIFTDHLDPLKNYMESRFEDLTKLHIPEYILDPFSFAAVDKLVSFLETESLDLKYYYEVKMIFKQSSYELALVKLMDACLHLWGQTELLISFPTTQLFEKALLLLSTGLHKAKKYDGHMPQRRLVPERDKHKAGNSNLD